MTETQTSSATEILRRRLLAGRPERSAEIEQERLNIRVAQLIYDLRKNAGLSQKELAERVHTSHSAISRLESADYRGHSLRMLQRILFALGHQLKISASPIEHPCGDGDVETDCELQTA